MAIHASSPFSGNNVPPEPSQNRYAAMRPELLGYYAPTSHKDRRSARHLAVHTREPRLQEASAWRCMCPAAPLELPLRHLHP